MILRVVWWVLWWSRFLVFMLWCPFTEHKCAAEDREEQGPRQPKYISGKVCLRHMLTRNPAALKRYWRVPLQKEAGLFKGKWETSWCKKRKWRARNRSCCFMKQFFLTICYPKCPIYQNEDYDTVKSCWHQINADWVGKKRAKKFERTFTDSSYTVAVCFKV